MWGAILGEYGMNWQDYFDPARFSITMATTVELVNYLWAHIAWIGVAALLAILIWRAAPDLSMFFNPQRWWAKTRLGYYRFRHRIHVWKLKTMGKVEDEAVSDRLMNVTMDWIEAEVHAKRMTRRQADNWYARLSRHWPEFRHCVEGISKDPKIRMLEEQANRDRNPDGTVKPVILPGAAPLAAKGGAKQKKQVTVR